MSRFQTFVIVILAIIIGSITKIWVTQNRTLNTLKQLQKITSPDHLPAASSKPQESPTADSAFSLLEEANSSLQTNVSNLLERVETLEKAPQTNPLPVGDSNYTAPAFQPQTLYLGTATGNWRDWTDAGPEITINSTDYPTNISAVFEAGISIPGGEGWVRLRNKTTGAILSASEIFHNNSTPTWKSSSSFKLHSGNNTYVVQLKATSGETITLSGSRIKLSQ